MGPHGAPWPESTPSARHVELRSWYEQLRDKYRPTVLRILLIGESPPDPSAGQRRFFYASDLTFDNLYRGVAEALYGDERDFDIRAKVSALERIRDDGYWLIDAVERPINRTSSSARRNAIVEAVPRLAQRCMKLAPEKGVIICHGLVYELASDRLRETGVRLLHSTPLPFPLGNWRKRFVNGFREAVREVRERPGV